MLKAPYFGVQYRDTKLELCGNILPPWYCHISKRSYTSHLGRKNNSGVTQLWTLQTDMTKKTHKIMAQQVWGYPIHELESIPKKCIYLVSLKTQETIQKRGVKEFRIWKTGRRTRNVVFRTRHRCYEHGLTAMNACPESTQEWTHHHPGMDEGSQGPSMLTAKLFATDI